MILPKPQVKQSNGRVEVEMFELALSYDRQERGEWKKAKCGLGSRRNSAIHRKAACVQVDAATMDRLLKVVDTGGSSILNKERSAFYHQPECHYAEIKLATHLISNCGYRPNELMYENWRLSSSADALSSDSGLQRRGAQFVQSTLGDTFLREMCALIDHNKQTPIASFFPGQSVPASAKTPTHNDHVDIFAYSEKMRMCAILEVKRDGERFAARQAILLAFASYLSAARRDDLGLPADLEMDVGFVRLWSKPVAHRSCRVTFETA